ncbi:MAG: inositol monophosphatase, partial [Duncaniella sp.]|nr:inositol monophosphatase [Duncaniella sp.]
KGGGAYLNGQPIECNHNTKISTMVVSTGMTYDRDVNPDNNLDNITRVCTRVRGIRRTGSAAIDLSYVAAGYFDIYWELDLKLWDIAAGQLILSEAGGIMEYLPDHRGHSIIAGSRESLDTFRHLVK